LPSPTTDPPAAATRRLASFLAGLEYGDLPLPVIERAKDLFCDWLGCALAVPNGRALLALKAFAARMGPATGPCEVLALGENTSPFFAALLNAAASHSAEQDDIHRLAVLHTAVVVFPTALAVAQEQGSSGRDFIVAVASGYEAGARVGMFLGPSHYRFFQPTGTAGTVAAAVTAAKLLGADESLMLHSIGSAGTQAAGLWQFLREAADSEQLHAAKAAGDGLIAAYAAAAGLRGAWGILEGAQGMGAAMSSAPDPTRLDADLGGRWAVQEMSFKMQAGVRHTHPASDALAKVMADHALVGTDIRAVRAHVSRAAMDVLGAVQRPASVHQAMFSMGFTLALLALRGGVGVNDFTAAALSDPVLEDFRRRVEMVVDADVDRAYPERWIGLVEVDTADGRHLVGRVDSTRGDPDRAPTRVELEQKALLLASHGGVVNAAQMRSLVDRVWRLESEPDLRELLAGAPTSMG